MFLKGVRKWLMEHDPTLRPPKVSDNLFASMDSVDVSDNLLDSDDDLDDPLGDEDDELDLEDDDDEDDLGLDSEGDEFDEDFDEDDIDSSDNDD